MWCIVAVKSLSRVQPFVTPWPAAPQPSLSFTIPWSLLKLMFTQPVMPSNYLILCHTLFLLLSIFPSIRVFPNELAYHIRWPKYCSFSFNISPSNEEYSGIVSFRIDQFELFAVQGVQEDFQESSAPQFESISSLPLGFLYGPNLTSIHDYWKKHSLDQTDLCWQSNVSAFKYAVQIGHSFASKEQASLNFMAAVTICSDFGAQENKTCHCFHVFPIY